MSHIEPYESTMMLIFHHLFTLTGWVLAIGIFRLRMQTYFWLTRWSEKGQHEICPPFAC